MATEENKPKLDLERLVKDGMLNLLTSMVTLLKRNQMLDFMVTTAETQMMKQLFGAILLQNQRDGNSVTQLVINIPTRVRTSQPDSGIQEISISFLHSQ